MSRIVQWSVTVALAGFLFGFDTAVISGADKPIQALWGLSDLQHGLLIMSMALWGTVLGAIFGNWPTDHLGRRMTLLLIGVLYLVSAIGSAVATDPWVFALFRLIGGIGVGVSSVAAPIYISEIAPPRHRGVLVAMYQFNIVFGILMAFVSNYVIGSMIEGDIAWRWMLGIEAIPALIYTLMITRVPRSPRWLILKRNDVKEASRVLRMIDPDVDVDAEIATMRAAENEERSANARFFSRRYRLPILLAFLIAFFNQLSGINFIIYYAPRVLEAAQLGSQAALLSTAGIGLVNLVFTMIGMSLIDRFGRRTLLFIGSAGYLLSLVLISRAFFTDSLGGIEVPLLLALFIAAHAISQGAVIWVFIAEVFPNHVRARGQSFGSSIHWVFAALITLVMPWVLGTFSGGPVFAFFAIMMLLQLVFVLILMPETRNVSLEELQKHLVGNDVKLRRVHLSGARVNV
ncbi:MULTISPECIES: sugar porter family MFS transporter [Halomonadaceae]|jgi:sugar porter (SP) family MFS transporter|uniref:Metabolite transport protein CsbC n=1 Tax=Vreelandella titanicae TaxID=664683 RepID=A0A653X5Z8_9GAMM|nr:MULTISPECIES: sugar porter family MFS transporter [Halomonas]KIN13169.1 MFS transporter [Halomonas sp. KHS3]MCD1588689.1 sugar porter family MFS transporter [Halomonas sp. IOP_14]QKS25225.1 putative metabolite transport protein CsbC [Halomonas titanicae]TMU28905.1 sugar porter family MFS transporter [Halomonas sp. ATBC28]CAD5256603.1 MFS transporter [Halomonas sp. 59]|tara:strand:- start:2136 stop:3515 length:1380 start_codon:yes stop_codon:yes gene_type:complete